MTPADALPKPPSRVPFWLAVISLAIIPVNTGIFFGSTAFSGGAAITLVLLSGLLVFAQFGVGLAAVIASIRAKRLGPAVAGGMAMVGSGLALAGGLAAAAMAMGSGGGAWGRPLRVRGRQLHPELKEGADWTRGERPDPSQLDEPTRRALEALWLHDAQKEHASVPAFSRVSWLLAAVGAPAELLEWSHKAALEEIEHTRRCFALAAGYAGRSHTVEPMPDLLLGGLDMNGDPLEVLARESLSDGCQLEDFNADVAAECATVCRESATRGVLERIAVEERSHAEFSWAVVAWLLETHRDRVAPALENALIALGDYARPTAVSADKRALVDAADAEDLRAHGRLPDERWGALWELRLKGTEQRLRALLGGPRSTRSLGAARGRSKRATHWLTAEQ
jgi:hypothetical protein